MRSQLSKLSTSTGLLVTGCPASRRKRRDFEIAQLRATCPTTDSSDSSFDSNTQQSVCNTDGSEDSSLSAALVQAVSSMNSVKISDSSTFSSARSRYLMNVSYGILIAFISVVLSFT